ncbi:MAG: HEAT repeat domain-containing protein [Limisphaerales bacterium]
MKSLRTRTWLLWMIAVLLSLTYLIFWVQPPKGWATRSRPSMANSIRALRTKDSKLNAFEVALWAHLPTFVHSYCGSLRPRLAWETRRDACSRLSAFGAAATNAVPYLIKALDDPDTSVRSGAMEAISRIGPPARAAKGPLLATLRDPACQRPTNMLSVMQSGLVAGTLAVIAPRDPEVVSALLAIMNDPDHRNPTNQFLTIQLGLVATTLAGTAPQDPGAVSTLLDLIARPAPDVSPAMIASSWIRSAPDPLAVFELIRKIQPKRDSWTLVSLVAANYQDPKKRLAVLLRLMEDPDYGIRYYAVGELGALGPLEAEAFPRLMELFRATEQEWQDLPDDARKARFEAYAAFVRDTAPRGAFMARRYGLSPAAVSLPALPAAPLVAAARSSIPSAPLTAPIGSRYATRGRSPPPQDRLPGYGGLHYQVILAFGELGPPARDAIPLLAPEYQDPTNPLRFEAAAARARIDGNFAEVMPVLAAGLDQAGPELRARLLPRIAQFASKHEGAMTLLIKALGDSDLGIRLQALRSLADLGTKAALALPALISALDGPESQIRFEALKTLGELGPDAAPAVPAMIKVLSDPEKPFRFQAVASLAAVGGKAAPALPALRQMAWDQYHDIRIMASNAVKTIESSTTPSPVRRGSGSAP